MDDLDYCYLCQCVESERRFWGSGDHIVEIEGDDPIALCHTHYGNCILWKKEQEEFDASLERSLSENEDVWRGLAGN